MAPARRRTAPLSVYAVVGGRGQPMAFRGGGKRFRLIGRGAIAAVVSDRSQPATPTSANLRRYDRTMRGLAERFPAILPARFGTSVSEDELLFILSSRRSSLARALALVRGRVQMTVRVMRSDADAPHVEEPFGSVSGRDYLAGKARAVAAARAVPAFEPIRRSVARWIRDERVDRRTGVTSIYHLIPRSSVDAYRRTLHAAAKASAVRLVVSGPWPPYAFGAD